MTEAESTPLQVLKRWFNRLFITVIISVIVITLINHWQSIQAFNWQIQPISLILAILVYISFFVIRGVTWAKTIQLLYIPIEYHVGLRTYIYTYTSRYIPGGLWTFVTLNTLAHSLGQSKRIFTVALIFNIFLLAYVDIIYFSPLIYEVLGIVGIIIYCASIYILPIFTTYGFKVLATLKFIPSSTDYQQLTQPKNSFRLFNYTLIHQSLQLLSYFILSSSLMSLTVSDTAYITIAYAISWLIGFLIVFVPQGLGIREVSFVAITTPIIPLEIAIALSIALRLLTIVSELTVFCCMLGYDKLKNLSKANQ